jgi:hypothetical protein
MCQALAEASNAHSKPAYGDVELDLADILARHAPWPG